MPQINTHLLVFGEQVIDKRPMIRNLVRNSKSSPAARRFLQEATDLVQIQLAQLAPDDHAWSGNFESLLGLAEEHHSREASDTALFFVTSLLSLIGRLGDLMVYVHLTTGLRETPDTRDLQANKSTEKKSCRAGSNHSRVQG